MSEGNLKPCPFCGGVATLWSGCGECYVRCDNCRSTTAYIDLKAGTEDEAIAAWNRRVDAPTAKPEPSRFVEFGGFCFAVDKISAIDDLDDGFSDIYVDGIDSPFSVAIEYNEVMAMIRAALGEKEAKK